MADGTSAAEVSAAPHNIEAEQALLGALLNSKDVFDLVKVVADYDQGAIRAAELFRAEQGDNPAYDLSRHILEKRFADEHAKGPVQYADFCLGGAGGSEDTRFRRQQLANEAVDVARLLLA